MTSSKCEIVPMRDVLWHACLRKARWDVGVVTGVYHPPGIAAAAVVFALFAPVMLVQFAMENASSLQVHGVQDHHRIVCEAVGIDPAWYQGGATGQNSLP